MYRLRFHRTAFQVLMSLGVIACGQRVTKDDASSTGTSEEGGTTSASTTDSASDTDAYWSGDGDDGHHGYYHHYQPYGDGDGDTTGTGTGTGTGTDTGYGTGTDTGYGTGTDTGTGTGTGTDGGDARPIPVDDDVSMSAIGRTRERPLPPHAKVMASYHEWRESDWHIRPPRRTGRTATTRMRSVDRTDFRGGVRHVGDVDPAAALIAVEEFAPDVWRTRPGEDDQSAVVLFVEGRSRERLQELVNHLMPTIDAAVEELSGFFGAPIRVERLILSRLESGDLPPLRRAGAAFLETRRRIYLPLATDENVDFWTEDTYHHLVDGRLYEIDGRRAHTLQNRGDDEALHLIIDLSVLD